MTYYMAKIAVTAVLVVLIAEISKRSSLIAALLASVPVTSVLAMLWLYLDTGDTAKVTELASSIFWLVLPSLALFILLPVMLSRGFGFYLSLGASIAATALCYGVMLRVLRYFGVML